MGLRPADGTAHTAVTLTFKYEQSTATNIAAARGARGPDVRLPPLQVNTGYKTTKLTSLRAAPRRAADGGTHSAITDYHDEANGAANDVTLSGWQTNRTMQLHVLRYAAPGFTGEGISLQARGVRAQHEGEHVSSTSNQGQRAASRRNF